MLIDARASLLMRACMHAISSMQALKLNQSMAFEFSVKSYVWRPIVSVVMSS